LPHSVPQLPQFSASTANSASQPSAYSSLQSLNPSLHSSTAHSPASQVGVPLATTQRLPQAPQSVMLSFKSVSHSPSPSQSPKPGSHSVSPHPSALQNTVTAGPEGSHSLPHSPQLRTSRVRSLSQPF